MRCYIASSWRNEEQAAVVEALRKDGHICYDFKHPDPADPSNNGFGWRQIQHPSLPPDRKDWNEGHFADIVLNHEIAKRGFDFDMDALMDADACVLALPCGRSAHLELGYAVGAGKLTIVYMPKLEEPELMYRMCDYVETTLFGVRRALSKRRHRPRWQRDIEAFDARSFTNATFIRELPCAVAIDGKGPCRDGHHRHCHTCGECWRHGACRCSPDLHEDNYCPHGHTKIEYLLQEIAGDVTDALHCQSCGASYARIGITHRWFEMPPSA